jgi:hypothetical protein
VAAIANKNAPTRAELNAGVDLSAEIAAASGWALVANMVDMPDLGSRFTSQVGGRLTSGPNDLTMYLSANGVDARSLLPRGTTGFIVTLLEGDNTGGKMNVFPVVVTSQAPDMSENAGQATWSFAVSSLPVENLTIP